MSANIVVLVDGNNLGIANHFVHDKLKGPNGRFTGATFGMIKSLGAIVEKFVPAMGARCEAYIAWDCPRHLSWRRQHYPAYKANRDDATPEDRAKLDPFYEQKDLIRTAVKALGFHQISAAGMEADDLAGYVCRLQARHSDSRSTILVSSDHDWLQLVSRRCAVWQNTRERLVREDNFEEVTGCVNPLEFLKMRGITGEGGDNVPGAKGIGEKYALEFLRGSMKKSGKRFEKIADWISDPEGMTRTITLIDLIHPIVVPQSIDIESGSLSPDDLRLVCSELGFESISSNLDVFCSKFERINN